MSEPAVGANNTFFIQTALGLESVALGELKSQFPLQTYPGGIEIQCSLIEGLALNYWMKTPVRILMRIASFRAKDFPTLVRKLQKLPWRQFVEKGEVRFHVSSQASRLKIKQRIEKACLDAYLIYHRGHEPKINSSPEPLDVYVRIIDDTVTISVDTSGEPLYRRGLKTHTVEAPLRENIAAALLQLTLGSFQATHHPIAWIDPMAGSGTFILEALTRFQLIAHRRFAFESFPSAQSLVQNIQSLAHSQLAQPHLTETYVALDASDKSLQALKNNLQKFNVKIEQGDLFTNDETWEKNNSSQRIVVTNPPFGERIKIQGSPRAYFSNCLEQIVKKFRPQVIGLLIPSEHGAPQIPKSYQLRQSVPFRHGGLAVTWYIYIAEQPTT